MLGWPLWGKICGVRFVCGIVDIDEESGEIKAGYICVHRLELTELKARDTSQKRSVCEFAIRG